MLSSIDGFEPHISTQNQSPNNNLTRSIDEVHRSTQERIDMSLRTLKNAHEILSQNGVKDAPSASSSKPDQSEIMKRWDDQHAQSWRQIGDSYRRVEESRAYLENLTSSRQNEEPR